MDWRGFTKSEHEFVVKYSFIKITALRFMDMR
jgi:hypothetical protein